MKFKSKKAIMAAALSAIAAANSFSMVAMAEGPAIYSIDVGQGWTTTSSKGSFSISPRTKGLAAGTPITVTAAPVSGGGVYVTVYGKGNQIIYSSGLSKSTISHHQFTMPSASVHVQISWAFPVNDNDAPTSTPDTKPDPITPTPTPTPDPTPTLSWKKGDANCDGKVTAEDATAVLKHLAGITELSYIGSVNADMDQNGKVTAADATAILKLLVGKS